MAKNVIIMIGDGMGWEMARAAAIQKQINEGSEGNTLSDFYTEGVGEGLSFQELEGFSLVTTSNTYIDGNKSNSALQGRPFDHVTGTAPEREGFEFDPNPALVEGFFPELRSSFGFDEDPIRDEDGNIIGGNLPFYDVNQGPSLPWERIGEPTDEVDGVFDVEYVKSLYPDSAGTATALYSGEKTYVGAIGVEIHEHDIETLGEIARDLGKSFGTVSSVPFNHATPAAAIAHVNQRGKTTEDSVNAEVDEFGHAIPDNDNILYQILNETQPELVLGGGHPDGRGDERYMDLDTLEELRAGDYEYTFLERGENAGQTLLEVAAEIDVNAGEKLFGLYGARGQGGNLPWRTADGDYSNAGLGGRRDTTRPLDEGETVEEFIAKEVSYNTTLMDMTTAALDVLGDDPDGFWVTIESGDIDWAAHDNNLDNMIGTTFDFEESVQIVMDWIEANGGYEENLLVVTADHDHYFTLNNDFPELLREVGAEALTENPEPSASGHFWGSDPEVKYGWGTHTTIPVPVYYEGAGSELLDALEGEGFTSYGEEIPGIPGYVDQTHLAHVQALSLTGTENYINGHEDDENLVGGDESDLIMARLGDDTVAGGMGDDVIFGGEGADILRGDKNSRSSGRSQGGDDTIFGGLGDDRIGGKGGDDELYGDEGNDSIWGDDGDDLIRGGLGDDVLTGDDFSGGQGSDTFILAVGEGTDTIVDFEVGTDFIGLADGLMFGDLSFTGNSIISGEETLAVLNRIDTTTLTESDFTSIL
ncbi:alkaline phosphatase [Dapis sp. BLCC M126]|uniref:alkaline phosphatase n=1 Tax=Dapis sp. BLCC M126 TaxID=3400189 RepID=UPI003CED8682